MAQILSPGALPDPDPVPTEPQEWQENLNIRLLCPECREDPPNLYEDHQSGDTICESCGIVLGQRGIDLRAEWRTFANDDQGNDDPSRVGDAPNPLLGGSQLETSIAFGDGSLRSKELHRAQNKVTADKNNRGLLQAFKQIGAHCDAFSLPQIVSDGAKHIYKDADESKQFKGKSQDALIAGCIFLSCRRNSVPRSFREIFELTKVSKKDIGRTFKALERFLLEQEKSKGNTSMIANGVIGLNESYAATATTSPAELCSRFCSILGLDQKCTNVAIDLAGRMSSVGALAGRSPLSGAAACIYMASYLMGQARTPKQISEAAKVSDSTIRNAYKSLYNEREKLIQGEWLQKGGNLSNLPKPS
ncbi:transcription initiation factor IIB [Sphaceloma murrayae]|uniref:Transcription initiation factor IIB n=1 Tax=Sphaceloma murrayae TaxID=2082308 RepID=A0A2K1QLT6_9PEZI|nr:transcription initiation factor IIB [Sphaceloma murrayae]